jgi:hypothetical protein
MTVFPALKDPEARVLYRFDFSNEFRSAGQELGSSDVAVVTDPDTTSELVLVPDLVISNIVNTPAGLVTFWVEGGTNGVTYWIRCRVLGAEVTPLQYRNDRTVGLRVRQL